jgi:hypothetical protein
VWESPETGSSSRNALARVKQHGSCTEIRTKSVANGSERGEALMRFDCLTPTEFLADSSFIWNRGQITASASRKQRVELLQRQLCLYPACSSGLLRAGTSQQPDVLLDICPQTACISCKPSQAELRLNIILASSPHLKEKHNAHYKDVYYEILMEVINTFCREKCTGIYY